MLVMELLDNWVPSIHPFPRQSRRTQPGLTPDGVLETVMNVIHSEWLAQNVDEVKSEAELRLELFGPIQDELLQWSSDAIQTEDSIRGCHVVLFTDISQDSILARPLTVEVVIHNMLEK